MTGKKYCTTCGKMEQWEEVMGLCEPCYDKLCEKNARIKTPPMDATTWNEIASTILSVVGPQGRKARRLSQESE